MKFQDILNFHLNMYIESGAMITGRLSFLIMFFKDIKENNLNVEQSREDTIKALKIDFFNESLNRLYETCLLRDVDKAIHLVGNIVIKIEKEETVQNTIIIKEKEEFPEDVPSIDREAFKNRKEKVDFEFLKLLGTDVDYLVSLGMKNE